MRLVGATRWFIRWPFMIEGVVVGFAGGLVAILILWLGKITIVDPLSDSISFLAAQNNSTLAFPALVGDPLRRRRAGLGGRLRRHPASLPEGLTRGMRAAAGSRPLAGRRCSPCSAPGSGSAGTRRSCPASARRLRRRQRRAQRRSDRGDRRQLLPRGLAGRADQLLAAGHGPGAAAALPRPLLRLLLAGEPGALQRRNRRPLLGDRARGDRGQEGPARSTTSSSARRPTGPGSRSAK